MVTCLPENAMASDTNSSIGGYSRIYVNQVAKAITEVRILAWALRMQYHLVQQVAVAGRKYEPRWLRDRLSKAQHYVDIVVKSV